MSSCLDEFIFHTSGKVAIPAISAIHTEQKGGTENDVATQEIPENLPDLDDTHDHIQEHLEERAAIMEYDGELPREQAEHEARKALRVYHYRLTDNPDTWLVLIAPGCDLDEATKSLQLRFGERFVDVREYKRISIAND